MQSQSTIQKGYKQLRWTERGPNLWCRNNVSTQMCWTWLVHKQFLRIRKVQKQTIITEEGNHYSDFFYNWGPLQINMCNDFTLSVPQKNTEIWIIIKRRVPSLVIWYSFGKWTMAHLVPWFSHWNLHLLQGFPNIGTRGQIPLEENLSPSYINLLNNIIKINCFYYLFKFIIHDWPIKSKLNPINTYYRFPGSLPYTKNIIFLLGGSLHSKLQVNQPRSPTPKRTWSWHMTLPGLVICYIAIENGGLIPFIVDFNGF